ncbi:MAG: cytochrome o ubiquinol oxidase subunit IV [Candidatus Saccharimonadales bacterium]
MNHDTKLVRSPQFVAFWSLTAGFVLSVSLTLCAYFVAVGNIKDSVTATVVLVILALVQLMVQLVFFLHFGHEKRPRWNMLAFCFMGIMLFVVVAGSIWIMYNLNYNMMTMTPDQKNTYMQTQSNKGF